MQRYSENDVSTLLEDGYITECKHSKHGRVTMYIDHINWHKERQLQSAKSLSSDKKKTMDDDNDRQFDSFLRGLHLNHLVLEQNAKKFEPEEGEQALSDTSGS